MSESRSWDLSENFTLEDLASCSKTYQVTGISNIPVQDASWEALEGLAKHILEPVVKHLGFPSLTVGFCSPALQRRMRSGIAPSLDQHAAHELNSQGRLVCPRGGAACDFFVEGCGSLSVAKWVVGHLDYDRLYFYGPDRPIHVSWSMNPTRRIVMVRKSGSTARRIPYNITAPRFLSLGL